MRSEVSEFRDGVFSLNTRRFGKVAELMIKKMYNFDESTVIDYDLKMPFGDCVEVKFSRVLKRCDSNINEDNIIASAIGSIVENRMLSFENAKKSSFDCNIQQIKTDKFRYLYYGCFFEDKIMICMIENYQIRKDPKIFYSDYQHSGNVGEGQFHINNGTIENHINNYLIKWITYDELYDMFK